MENFETEVVKHLCEACMYSGDAVSVNGKILCPNCGCPADVVAEFEISDHEVADYIQMELMKEGVAVTKDDILRVLYLQDEFMVRKGMTYIPELEGEPPDAETSMDT